MQHIINWNKYFIYSGFCFLTYYAFIAFRYFGKDLLHLKFPGAAKKKNKVSGQGIFFNNSVSTTLAENSQNPLSATIYDFVEELKHLLNQSAAQESAKFEIVNSITSLIRKYPTLKGSTFQGSITNLIAAETESKCNMHLNTEDLRSIWS